MQEYDSGKNNFLYGFFDESNHGRFPEIFAMVFSKFKSDLIPTTDLEKTRKNHLNLFNSLKKRDYSFLVAGEKDYKKLRNELKGTILSSLLIGKLPNNLEGLFLYVDGCLTVYEENYARDIISEHHNLSKKIIRMNSGSSFDISYPGVNLADELAHYLFQKTQDRNSMVELFRDKNLRTLKI